MAHTLTTHRTTTEVEARDTKEEPLRFRLDPIECDGRYERDENVILTSADGDWFIGHIVETDYDNMRILVELD